MTTSTPTRQAPRNRFISTSIPYVNGEPHLGFALEAVLADTLARYYRAAGDRVFFLTGTDDNALKNALAAEQAGVETRELVRVNGDRFAALRATLQLSNDDFLRTSSDPRHLPAVTALWQQCERRGDLYQQHYEGLYCVGCEAFLAPADLVDGHCPVHAAPLQQVAERNYFFRLSQYQGALIDMIETGRLRIEPVHRRAEVLSFLHGGVRDLSVSRAAARARHWGLSVPGDPQQVIYVWFDALANYISALGYGGAEPHDQFEQFWRNAHITHVVGKDISRFHGVYWPAILTSAGLPLPHRLAVHGFVTVAGTRLSKSADATDVTLANAIERHGLEPLKYFLLRHIGSHHDGEFSWARFDEVYRTELADQLGNLLSRTIAMIDKYRQGRVPTGTATPGDCALPILNLDADTRLSTALAGLDNDVARAVDDFALHRAVARIWEVVDAANAFVNAAAPWRLAADGQNDALDASLGRLWQALAAVASNLRPFLPDTAEEISDRLGIGQPASERRVRLAPPLFPKPLSK